MIVAKLHNKFWKEQIYRYIIVGAWNTIFGFLVITILKLTAMPPLNTITAVTIASVLSVVQSYVMQRKFVWRSSSEIYNEFPKFIVIAIFQYIVGLLLIIYFVDHRKFPLLPTQLIVSLTLVAITFVLMRSWTFASHHQHEK